jgi:hypothetical protein
VTPEPEPQPEETQAPPERREQEEATRGPGHERPDEIREDVGLDEPRRPQPER